MYYNSGIHSSMVIVKKKEKREPGSPAHARSTEHVIDAKSDDLYDREMQFVAAPFIYRPA
jgi:hypothetical protein